MEKSIYEVSVIIPTYNRSKLLNYTLGSLLKQSISKDQFEVIVSDDGSTDDTAEVVKKYSDKLNLKYVFQEDKGYRPASARNKGILLSEAKICVFIDSSVILDENCLDAHIRFHSGDEQSKAAIGYVYAIDHNDESEKVLKGLIVPDDPANSILRLSEFEIFQDVREQHYIKHKNKIEDLPAPWFYFWTCHVSVLKKDLIKIGLFDEKYDGRWGVEDNDLGYRLHVTGVRIHLLKDAAAIHYPHEKDKIEKASEAHENGVYFHNKYKTLATELFLKNFIDPTDATVLTDLNDLLLAKLIESNVSNGAIA